MSHLSRAKRERAEWCTLSEAAAHICKADGCNQNAARQQLQKALADGVLAPLRWADARPAPRVGGATVPLDLPPVCIPENAEIDWEAGTVGDEWGDAAPTHRVLLIWSLALQGYWPEMHPLADWHDEYRYEAQQARLMRGDREKREAADAAWKAAWDAERTKPIRQRAFFSAEEIADALAINPRTLKKDLELWARVIESITEWVAHQIFDLAAGEVATLRVDPPEFAPLSALSPEDILADPSCLMLRRDAAERFVKAHDELPNAGPIHYRWFNAAAPNGPEGGGGKPAIKRDIPHRTLRAYLKDFKAKGRTVPARDPLVDLIRTTYPTYKVTRSAVRSVHEEVFGKLPPGKRSKNTD